MPQATYSARALVVRKVKLGETDRIVHLIADDGRLVKAVAKGARKPTSPFSSRLEVFSVVDVLLAQGRSLDIVKEARLVDAHAGVRLDLLRAAAAAPLIECIAKAAQPDLPNPRSYACAVAALDAMDDAEAGDALAIGAAALLKVYSFTGFRPSFDACVSCGRRLDVDAARQERSLLAFSAFDGGVLCDSCGRFSDAVRLSAETLGWARFLLMSTFDDIEARHVERRISFDVLHLCQTWTRAHLGGRSKALDFVFSCGLF
ncbi:MULTISPECIES: DNA repair protein RecO [Slackia]|uniref:DNA repair protein RecO n=1 Tax=Slackia exigua (strain ATCC 700122 / DSM 15923 / CIP 105133 / JCM 11022 / KCTC 5966 / S-7) TaxID=649764 RepID=D0WER6_SLAES|nr:MULTISPECIES: DNA repair protein RecO [Slackia]MDU6010477.1 DNA repair protein RecO [Slackia sp.]EEZ62204.1 DNA repair protein RecO [Slackia exigua ATCC 700122]EJU32867.1 DNA repair protein RecO [Slackia sp. CM382]MCK6139470.1 DNA repair protein RecO [Slackia exigua]MCQ5091388.1 DNA repair protein RecO [Slackia exigua]